MRRLLLFAALVTTSAAAAPVDRAAISAAVDRGVTALKRAQRDDGSWHNTELGATSLAALALLECDVAKDDAVIKSAAAYVRRQALTSTHVYALSLSILFLDRLGEPTDTPLIESMIIRLLAGQGRGGAWGYDTPSISADESKRIMAEMDGSRVLRGGGDLKKLPERGKRTAKDLPDSIRDQLNLIARGGGGGAAVGPGGDNSNTQFAVLALWVGRRYGVPTHAALVRARDHFRVSQSTADGGWSYVSVAGIPNPSEATMTCAGVLALAVGQGAAVEVVREKNPKIDSADVSKDASLTAGLAALGAAIGAPIGWDGTGARPAAVPAASGKFFYFVWSLERIAVALNLTTIGKKDWYNWGAEILLANQAADGMWNGEYSGYYADTCFALLFLKRANLTADLSARITGLKDPGTRKLAAGGVGADSLKEMVAGPAAPGVGEKAARKLDAMVARTPDEKSARELGQSLVKARGDRRRELLETLRDTRGVAYTEALALTIRELDGDEKRDARQALTMRLTRMKDATLADYFADDDAEIRRAAALASGTKGIKEHVKGLVKLLRDADEQVRRAAHAALKATTGQKLELDAAAWERWEKETRRE